MVDGTALWLIDGIKDELRESPGDKGSGGDVMVGKTEVAMCVYCAQTLEDGLGGGGGL